MKFFHCPLIHLITSTVYLSMIAFSMYSLLNGNKMSEAQTNPNQVLKKTVDNTSFESPAMNIIATKHFKSYFNLQAEKPYLAPQCYVIEKRLLLNEPTNPTIQKDTDWTKKLLEKWC